MASVGKSGGLETAHSNDSQCRRGGDGEKYFRVSCKLQLVFLRCREIFMKKIVFFTVSHISPNAVFCLDLNSEWKIMEAPISAISHCFCIPAASFCEVIAGYHQNHHYHRYQYLFIKISSQHHLFYQFCSKKKLLKQ